jgi:hypothetical protein
VSFAKSPPDHRSGSSAGARRGRRGFERPGFGIELNEKILFGTDYPFGALGTAEATARTRAPQSGRPGRRADR